jgi:hypothetical protein
VNAAPGITISGIANQDLSALTFTGAPSSPVTLGTTITITISGTVTVSSWYIDANGAGVTPTGSTTNTVTFNAPGTPPGFYNVNVFAIIGGVLYSGSFGMSVK